MKGGGMRVECFHVVESEEGIQKAIEARLVSQGGMTQRCVALNHPALLVVSPRAAERGLKLPNSCRTVLLPGDAGALLTDTRAASAVSYGRSGRDSLTISSREPDRVWAALQRELVTVGGHVVERQEFPITLSKGQEELSALAVAGALLLLGVPAENLSVPVFPA